jgi:hypothetical protein
MASLLTFQIIHILRSYDIRILAIVDEKRNGYDYIVDNEKIPLISFDQFKSFDTNLNVNLVLPSSSLNTLNKFTKKIKSVRPYNLLISSLV